MALSNDLIQEFASVMGNAKEKHVDTTCYGKVTRMESSTNGFIQLDGADSETPASFTVAAHVNDRVLAILKNRSALVIGNITHPVIMTGTLYASDAIVVEGYLTTNASRTRYNDTSNNGLTFDSNGIGAYSNLSSWWLKNDGTFQFGGENGITFSDNKVRFGSDVVLTWGSISGKPDNIATTDDIPDGILTTSNYTGTITKTYIDGLNVIAENISGTTLSGKTISGGQIQIGTASNNAYPFQVTSDGAMTATSGKIGGLTINGDKLYTNNHSAYNTNVNGVYIDDTYIALGPQAKSYIKSDGSFQFGGANGITYANSKVTLGSDVSISWSSVTDTSNVAVKSDIPSGILTTSNVGDTVNATYIDNRGVAAEYIRGSTLSGKNIYCGTKNSSNVYPFQVTSAGVVTATSGTIGGWSLGTNKLYSGSDTASTNTAGYITLSTADFTRTINGTSRGSLRFAIGSNFGVSSSGVLYSGSAVISGTLTAGANSKIGPWNVTDTAIWYGTTSAVTGANAYKNANGLYFGTSGLSLKDKFYVTAAGVPHCDGADLFINSPVTSGNSSGLYIQVRDTTFGVIRVDGVGTTSQSFNVVGFNGNASSPVYNTLYLGGDDIVLNAESSVTINPGAGYCMYVHNTTFVGASKTSPYTQPGIGLYTNGNLTLTYDGGGAGIYFAYNKATSYTVGLYESASGTITCTGKLSANGGFVGALTGNVTGNCSGSSGSCTGQIKNVEGNSYYGIVTSSTDKQRIATIRCSTDTTGRIIVRGQFNSTTYSTRYFDTSPTSSDIRLKTNIEYSSVSALPIINAIKIRSFDWKEDMRHQRIGMVADELEILDPMFTVGGGCEEDGSINVKAVNSFYLQGYIVKAIQELSDENQKLKEEISKLKGAA